MTEMSSSPIQQRTVARQTTEPANPLDGFLWINPEGGQNGNNAERYLYNGGTASWDLLDSTGPDTPLHAAAGASWTDTGTGTVKNYRSGVWENVGVTDHANLSNLQSGHDHSNIRNPQPNDHRHVEAKESAGASADETVSWSTAFSTTPLVVATVYYGSFLEIGTTVTSRSTTAAQGYSWDTSGTGISEPKMFVAMEGT